MNTNVFEDRLKEWNIPFAIVANLESGESFRVGCSSGFGFDDLENMLFRDADTIFATGRSLEAQLLPRTWSQGNVFCLICKPNSQTIVGLFGSNQRRPIEIYHWAKELNIGIVEAFANE